MVRYIKDGAYTIVVDDGSTDEGDKDDTNNNNNKENANSDEKLVKSPLPPSRSGLDSRQKLKSKQQLENELDRIDYTDPSFILQNLSIAAPKYENDDSFTLFARKEIAEMVSHQILFYVYCLLQGYIYNDYLPNILFFGEGFIGNKVIQLLLNHGCASLLRLYSRSEFGLEEWKKVGVIASSNLYSLMGKGKEKADIIILCSEYSSFQMIYHLIKDANLIHETTSFITSTLGFQRKKLFYNFGIPTIFRTYVEPQKEIKQIKEKKMKELSLFKNKEISTETDDDVEGIPRTQSTATISRAIDKIQEEEPELAGIGKAHEVVNKEALFDDECSSQMTEEEGEGTMNENISVASFQDTIGLENIDESCLTTSEKAAFIICQRTRDMKHMLFVLENYYSLQDFTPEEARFLALRSIFGYNDSNKKSFSGRRTATPTGGNNAKSVKKKRAQVSIAVLEKILLSMFMEHINYFQTIFSKVLRMEDLMKLTDPSLFPSRLHAHLHHPSSPLSEYTNSTSAFSSPKPLAKRETFIDNKGKHHLLPDEGSPSKLKTHALYDTKTINAIFETDDDYSSWNGPGFDYIRTLDSRDEKKSSKYLFDDPNKPVKVTGFDTLVSCIKTGQFFNAVAGSPSEAGDVASVLMNDSIRAALALSDNPGTIDGGIHSAVPLSSEEDDNNPRKRFERFRAKNRSPPGAISTVPSSSNN
jgi:hypothetical protein